MIASGEPLSGEVEVLCMSPNSDSLFTQTVNLSQGAEGLVSLEDRTSENSAIVRAEVREVYEEMTRPVAEIGESMENSNRERYESELNESKRR